MLYSKLHTVCDICVYYFIQLCCITCYVALTESLWPYHAFVSAGRASRTEAIQLQVKLFNRVVPGASACRMVGPLTHVLTRIWAQVDVHTGPTCS